MGFLNKASYLKALFRMLPFGLAALFYGGNGLINNRTADNLFKIEGKILFSGIKKLYTNGSYLDAFVFHIVDNRFDTISCHTFGTSYIEKLMILNGKEKEYITIWVDPEIENSIKQVMFKNQLIPQIRTCEC